MNTTTLSEIGARDDNDNSYYPGGLMSRVKFHSKNDLSSGYYLTISAEVLNKYIQIGCLFQNINDVIEFYNIKKYMDNDMYLLTWESELVEQYLAFVKHNYSEIAKFIKSINSNNLLLMYKEIELDYRDDFWELFERFKCYLDVDNDTFNSFIYESNVPFYELIKQQNLIRHYGKVIRDQMIQDRIMAEILIDKFECLSPQEAGGLYLPKELTNEDKEKIIIEYIDSDDANLNYIRMIANIRSNPDSIVVSPKTLLKAKRKATELESIYFSDDSGMEIETKVTFSKTQEEAAIIDINGLTTTAIYSANWVDCNTDFATLLNNFIFLFEYVDLQMRCSFVSKLNQMSTIEQMLATRSQNDYIKGSVFNSLNMLSLLQLKAYDHYLRGIGIRIENIIEWFASEYLPTEFGIDNFIVRLPSENSTYLEKCSSIMPALESFLKQYTLYVEDGYIELELLGVRTSGIIYRDIPSLIIKKYVYGSGEEFKIVTNLLFSDQSGLGYIHQTKESFKNLFELLSKRGLNLTEVEEFNKARIDWLIERGYLIVAESNSIVFSNREVILILYDLYKNDVIAYWNFPLDNKRQFEELEAKGIISFEDSLLSKPEQEYFNYTLNRSMHNNGLDLRNKYSHTQPQINDDEKIHEYNYLYFLRLFIISIIKINDELTVTKRINGIRKQLKDGLNIT